MDERERIEPPGSPGHPRPSFDPVQRRGCPGREFTLGPAGDRTDAHRATGRRGWKGERVLAFRTGFCGSR